MEIFCFDFNVIDDIRDFIPGESGQFVFDVVARKKFGVSPSDEERNLVCSIFRPYLAAIRKYCSIFLNDVCYSCNECFQRQTEYFIARAEYEDAVSAAKRDGRDYSNLVEPVFPSSYKSEAALFDLAKKYDLRVEDADDFYQYCDKVLFNMFMYHNFLFDVSGEKLVPKEIRDAIKDAEKDMSIEESVRIVKEMSLYEKFKEYIDKEKKEAGD